MTQSQRWSSTGELRRAFLKGLIDEYSDDELGVLMFVVVGILFIRDENAKVAAILGLPKVVGVRTLAGMLRHISQWSGDGSPKSTWGLPS
jgi:hypothetical protein